MSPRKILVCTFVWKKITFLIGFTFSGWNMGGGRGIYHDQKIFTNKNVLWNLQRHRIFFVFRPASAKKNKIEEISRKKICVSAGTRENARLFRFFFVLEIILQVKRFFLLCFFFVFFYFFLGGEGEAYMGFFQQKISRQKQNHGGIVPRSCFFLTCLLSNIGLSRRDPLDDWPTNQWKF